MGLSPSVVTRLVSRLEKRQLVTRTSSAPDRRCVCPVLTSAGRTLIERLRLPASHAVREGLGEAENQPALARLAQAFTPTG
ncbi:MarR family transcriptional regulator [Streptomyces sp. BA2]|uniref:MarR family transcriptional regulator n=1 Tax=Streptomyces sp. BA2 TaxID=436595 RepID=UPI0019227489